MVKLSYHCEEPDPGFCNSLGIIHKVFFDSLVLHLLWKIGLCHEPCQIVWLEDDKCFIWCNRTLSIPSGAQRLRLSLVLTPLKTRDNCPVPSVGLALVLAWTQFLNSIMQLELWNLRVDTRPFILGLGLLGTRDSVMVAPVGEGPLELQAGLPWCQLLPRGLGSLTQVVGLL